MQAKTCEILYCPDCHGTLDPIGVARGFIEEGLLRCSLCNREFPVRGGIPMLLGERLSIRLNGEDFAAIDEDTRQKILQREWHDRERLDQNYKRASYGSRSFFAYLLYYQMRELEKWLQRHRYSRIANIGAGHGFELEFLSLFSHDIVAIDISWKSLRLALDRASELGLRVEAVCADAENLPVRNRSFDLAFTHHSLHHLPNPMRGLEEMIRISSRGVALSEPAKGLTRSLLTRLGVKPEIEESGNFVYEFDPKEVKALCSNQRLQLQYFRKCLITGPADEPTWSRRFDSWHITPAICRAIALGNSIAGNLLGTKCSFLLEKSAQ